MHAIRLRTSLGGAQRVFNRRNLEAPSKAVELITGQFGALPVNNSKYVRMRWASDYNTLVDVKSSKTLLACHTPIRSSANTSIRPFTPRKLNIFGTSSNGFNLNTTIDPRKMIGQVRFASSVPTSENDIVTPFPDHCYHTQQSVEKYRKEVAPGEDKRDFAYFVVSGGRFAFATGVRATALHFIYTMTPSKSVMALASIDVDISSIPEGKTVTLKWRGKPIFIRHRTPDEIEAERTVDVASLRDPQPDEARYADPSRPEMVVLLGVCTHLGCVPLTEAGDIPGGFFCPCHGSHYDTAGRIRKGPAPKNLEIPPYKFIDKNTILIG
eukprot:GEZU01038993.1.p2 GENE.GEZU01038993.1~~GEZU01038993.1.p2  ORF type:complete len:325 (-),score=93.92 GEZU01038993.1:1076-2050(-)